MNPPASSSTPTSSSAKPASTSAPPSATSTPSPAPGHHHTRWRQRRRRRTRRQRWNTRHDPALDALRRLAEHAALCAVTASDTVQAVTGQRPVNPMARPLQQTVHAYRCANLLIRATGRPT